MVSASRFLLDVGGIRIVGVDGRGSNDEPGVDGGEMESLRAGIKSHLTSLRVAVVCG